MAVHTRHPVSAPPAAPVRESSRELLLRGWCVFVLVLALGGTAWIHAAGALATGIVTVASGVVSAVLWAMLRPNVRSRRMPWFTLAYVAFACLSLIWTAWLNVSALTALLLVVTTVQGLFIAAVLVWRDIVRALASALKWVLGLSVAFELWVSLVWHGPILPGWQRPDPAVDYDPIVYWSRDNLFDLDGRIQGIFGNANLLAGVTVLALIVFGIRYAAGLPRRGWLIAWMVVASALLVRAGSATSYLSVVAVAVVLGTVLLMRTTTRPGERTRWYLLYAAVALAGAATWWFGRDLLFSVLGRDATLTGRGEIWSAVLERATQRPVAGWGFATPWVSDDPRFHRWIVDHGESVMQAHNMWLDVFLQLGAVGVVLLAGAYLAFVWRAWFFAIDRPRFDLRADRPYSPLSVLPTLVATLLLVQGLTESGPLLVWGWLLFVLLAFKIKQAPLVGVGPAEQSRAIERGEPQTSP